MIFISREREWLMADMIIIVILAIAAFFVIRSQLQKIKRGGCGGGCSGCSGCACREQERQKPIDK